jgi:hypothetical protein
MIIMKEKKTTCALLATILAILILSMTTINFAYPSSYPSPNRIYIDPPEKKYHTPWGDGDQLLGDQFTVDVKVENVSATGQLRATDFQIWYNTTLLDLVSVTTPIGWTYKFDKSNETEGLVRAGGVISPIIPEIWPSGNVTIFQVTFNVTYVPPYCTSPPALDNVTVSCPLTLNETELVDKDAGIYTGYNEESGYYEYARDCKPVSLPTAAFTWSPTIPYESDTVTLNASASDDGGAGPLTYLWTITGNATLTGPNNTVTTTMHCDGPGTVNVTLAVTNTIPLSDTVTHQIEQLARIVSYQHTVIVGTSAFEVYVLTNSTESDFNFNQSLMRISFSVTGPDGTVGFCNVIIPKELLWLESPSDVWVVLIDGETATDLGTTENVTHTFLYFTYTHSLHNIIIRGTGVVPEFPTAIVAPLLLIATLAATLLTKMFRSRKRKHTLTAE